MTIPVPQTLDAALSPQWLTAALRPRFPGLDIARVTAGPIVDRVSTNALVTIDTIGPAPAELPARLCVKGYFNEVGRQAPYIGEPEASFYRDVAAGIGVRTLPTFYADVDPTTRHGVVVSADITAAGGVFLDVRHSVFTPDDAAESLRLLAGLHAASWTAPPWAAAEWLTPRLGRTLRGPRRAGTTARIAVNLHGANGRGVPTAWRDPDRLVDGYLSLVDGLGAQRNTPGWCVIHGDTHLGNFYRTADGLPALLDWQLVQRGMWYLDVGYHLAAALDVDDRRAHERDLLAHYLDCLRATGVDAPAWPVAWRSLGDGILHGLYLWAITTYVDPAIIEIMLRRLGTAAADHANRD